MINQSIRHQQIWCLRITNQMILLVNAAVIVLLGAAFSWATPAIVAKPVITDIADPIAITNAGDGSGRLFVTLQNGRIIIFDGTRVHSPPFLDIALLVSSGGESGLLSVAFHPNFATNGFFFVNYTNIRGDTVIARYSVSANPNIADPNSAVILLTITQPFSNHNGGQLQFGPDGYLYIGMGDGGSGGDPQNNAQNLTTLLGKMLRIDIDSEFPYAIPPDNPFRGNPGVRDEIWSLGLRNPWRFSFDRLTGDLFIADVGQNSWEEVDFQPASSSGGENYGWRLMEGHHCFNPPSGCDNGSLTLPILVYDHSVGCSITGGYRYRGIKNRGLEGIYFYGDFCTGRIWGASEDGSGDWTATELLDTSFLISAFGEDETGEIYFAHRSSGSGAIYQIVEMNNDPTQLCNGIAVTILGTDGHDFLEGTEGPDVIHGLGGNDVIIGSGGDDIVCGGDGQDIVGTGSGNDIVFGENGHDAIWGGLGNDTLHGGDGNDSINGGSGNDGLHGNHGNDTLKGGGGVDELYGGTGPNNGSIDNNDTCYDESGTFIRGCEVFYQQDFPIFNAVSLNDPLCNGKRPTILGTDGHDFLEGTEGPDVIHGLGGNDVIIGLGGGDVICGGDGQEVIGAGSGNDIVYGENGHDAIWGGPGDDIVRGGDGNDSIYGGPGNDVLRGNHGNDSIYGISGVNELYGGWGPNSGSIDNNDTCYDAAGTFTKGCEVFYEQ